MRFYAMQSGQIRTMVRMPSAMFGELLSEMPKNKGGGEKWYWPSRQKQCSS
jgi:hypothetical protein